MTQAAGKSSSTKKGDFKAGGRLQAQLRLLASKELEKKPKLYMIDGDLSSIATDTKRAGFSLNHTASTLLQTPAIWTFAFGLGIIHSNDGIFTSFAVMPHRPTNRLQLYIFVCKLNITNGFAHQKKFLKTFAMVGLKQPRLSLGTRNSMEEETKMAPIAKPCLSLASTDPLPAGLPQIMIQVAYSAFQLKELKQHWKKNGKKILLSLNDPFKVNTSSVLVVGNHPLESPICKGEGQTWIGDSAKEL